MRVEDAEQKVVASNDDANANVTDPTLQFTAREDGDYVCIVEDLSGRPLNAGSVFQFRLETQPAAAAGSPPESSDFAVTAPQQIQLPIGGKASLKVTVLRQGFNGEIRLEVEGLPMGVTVPEKLGGPAKKPTATIAFTCGDDVAANAAPIRIRARAVAEEPKDGKAAETNGHEIVREVKAVASGNLAPRSDADTHESTFLLTTTMKPRYKVLLIDKNRQRAVHRGTTYPAPFVIEREEGYNAEVQLTMASKQSRHRQGIWGPVLTVPPKDTEAFYPCHLPEWLETDRTTRMIVLGVALDKDPQGNVRQVTQPSDARITMILEGALLRIAHSVSEPTVPKGGDLVVPFQLSRSKKLPGQVKVELVAPPEIAGFLNSEPVTVAADKSTGVLKIYSEPHERLQGSWDIALRATAMQDGRWPVVSTTKVTVEFE